MHAFPLNYLVSGSFSGLGHSNSSSCVLCNVNTEKPAPQDGKYPMSLLGLFFLSYLFFLLLLRSTFLTELKTESDCGILSGVWR